MYGRDLKISYESLAGMGRNPNLAGVVVVGLEETSTNTVADRIRNSGKPVETVLVQELGGTIAATATGIRAARNLVIQASKSRRRELPSSMLTIGVECGGSDTTSGLASNPCTG